MCPAVPTTMFMGSDLDFLAPDARPRENRDLTRSPPAALALLALATAGALLPLLVDLRHRLAAARSALAFAHALENLRQPQIDLPHFHVDPDDLHLHFVAEPVLLVGV